jgi:hypothetical protein
MSIPNFQKAISAYIHVFDLVDSGLDRNKQHLHLQNVYHH